jgi:hypothetical protein
MINHKEKPCVLIASSLSLTSIVLSCTIDLDGVIVGRGKPCVTGSILEAFGK